MIEDTRLWNRENKKGHYVNSDTAKRRLRIGRAQQGRERASKAQPRAPAEPDDPRYAARQSASRASVEPDPRYMPPPPIARASADNVTLERQRQITTASPSPRPASAQPTQNDPRRPPTSSQYSSNTNPGYIQATAQYTVQANIPQAQYASYGGDTAIYDSAPPPYQSDTKRGGSSQPSTTGTQGFGSMYATSGGPPPPRAPNQGQRRHGS
ncbi:hypothetical protein OHC33_001405 [Knufia fluminis]|uniref:Uncharacterized protein n=2 Tax=Knufia TaxID=430999 RepID=A0AAN8IAR4_9EURO|nr:hypothetical protein OHC33_001405 [Knufia fluminis]